MSLQRWTGRVAVVTGASAGIGLAIAKELVNLGMTVIGLARRPEGLAKAKAAMEKGPGKFHPLTVDVSKLEAVKEAFKQIKNEFHRVHLLVNNAGIYKLNPLLDEGNEQYLKEMMDVNVMGYIFCAKETYQLMKNTDEECIIINIGSVSAICITAITSDYNMYPSAKAAVRAAGEVLRHELLEKNNFRVTTINPGIVNTNLFDKDIATKCKFLHPEDISFTVRFILTLPAHAVVTEMTIKPVGENF